MDNFNNMEKKLPIFNLEITNEDDSDVEVDFVALVDRPAIERQFLAFAEDSYNDYPEAAVNNAKRALKWLYATRIQSICLGVRS